MKRLVMAMSLILMTISGGCATIPQPGQQAVEEEWPTGLGIMPPSWYDYNPALKHWFDLRYHNPYDSSD
jgi:hypothetical protein